MSAHKKQIGVALVTGACSGIGRELAEGLAARGHALFMVSHRQLELSRAADELRAAHGVDVRTLVMDLARPTAGDELYEAVRAQGVEPEVLVSNAGVFFFGQAVDASPALANAMLQLHVVTPSLLCTRFGRDFRERRSGHILLVSSISAWRDFPGIAYYGSSKKYLRGFARALRSELRRYDVNVTCLSPGATATQLYEGTNVPVKPAVRLGVMMPAKKVAEAGLRALFARKAECIPGIFNAIAARSSTWIPQWLLDLVGRWAPWLERRGVT